MNILITGARRGIGAALLPLFLQDGDHITAVSCHGDTARAKVLNAQYPGTLETRSCDLSEPDAAEKLAPYLAQTDILINNAGQLPGKPWQHYPPSVRDKLIALNLETPVALITAAAPHMIKRGGGRIVNVASQAAVAGNPDIWYGMTKAALVNATKSFAGLLGPSGIVVNAVSPGPVATEMVADSPYQNRFAKIQNRTYLKRLAEPKEIANVIHWLAKESPPYLSGENLIVNNGAFSLDMPPESKTI
jgi:3-oxoacyl-[acyl-carrier protein] reductase